MLIKLIDERKKEIFFIILLAVFFYRSPHIFLHGRFMAEEGEVFFAYAFNNSILNTLFFVDFRSGYFNIWANISGLVSNFFSLNNAPLVSNYLSLFPKILIILFSIYSKSIFFKFFWQRVLFCLLVFISPQNVPEIWMNSINSQIFFCILAFVLILKDYEINKIHHSNYILIFIAGLSGIYSCILTPVFYFKFFITKKRQDLLNFSAIFICTIIQFMIIVYSKFSNVLYSGKLHSLDLDLFYNYTYNVLFRSFFGSNFTKLMYSQLESNPSFIIFFSFFLIFIIGCFFYYLIKNFHQFSKNNKFIFISIIYIFISTSFVVLIGAVSKYVGGRYAALPSFYLLFFILFLIFVLKNQLIKKLLFFILIISNFAGLYEFRPLNNNIVNHHHSIKSLDCINCPNWNREVELFIKDKNYDLKIWPYPNKSMKLN